MLKLFVGDTTEELANYASQHGDSVLVTKKNYKKIIEKSKKQDIIAHTSMGDMPKDTFNESTFFQLLLSADELVYAPPTKKWSDHSDTYQIHSMQRLTEFYLYNINMSKNNVRGLTIAHWIKKNDEYLKLVDFRRTENKNLWISGCSISHGVGVEKDQCYGSLLANELNLPVSFLTKPGSSIEWASDQILRSDIRQDDIVVWGLTSEYRSTEWRNRKVTNIASYGLSTKDMKTINTENCLYKALLAVNQVENFCTKIGAKLILFPVISSESLRLHLSNNQCYYEKPYQEQFVDWGNDNVHPGPDQHKFYTEFLKNIIKGINL